MESKLIYAAVNGIKSKVTWKQHNGEEWLHIGLGNKLKKEIITQFIHNQFNGKEILIVLERTNSKSIHLNEIETEIFERIGLTNFIICDKKFTRFMEFHQVGIMRIGELKNN